MYALQVDFVDKDKVARPDKAPDPNCAKIRSLSDAIMTNVGIPNAQ
jgi:hypothetical protein